MTKENQPERQEHREKRDDEFDELEIHTKHPANLINKTLLGLLCGSLGFGLSQLTIAGDVRVHAVEISGLKASFMDERRRTDERVAEILDQMKQQISVTTAILQSNQQLVMQNDRFISLLSAKAIDHASKP